MLSAAGTVATNAPTVGGAVGGGDDGGDIDGYDDGADGDGVDVAANCRVVRNVVPAAQTFNEFNS